MLPVNCLSCCYCHLPKYVLNKALYTFDDCFVWGFLFFCFFFFVNVSMLLFVQIQIFLGGLLGTPSAVSQETGVNLTLFIFLSRTNTYFPLGD